MSVRSTGEVRKAFVEYFRGKGHEVVQSAPLVPPNDPTLLFTNAGMVQFKDVFVGKETRPYRRAASSQKCIRISGKHNDLENVGVTARHHTFFEMLGNFSFGDYFKEEAIVYAWELLTASEGQGGFGLSPDKLVITVFGGDPADASLRADGEARDLWRKVTGFPDEKIIGLGMKDNFWQMGDTGPCGPCTEIHYFTGEGPADLSRFLEEPGPDGLGFMEIWNLVFMQFERKAHDGAFVLDSLPKPSVDTGMGLERIASVLNGKSSNYETDVLRALIAKVESVSGKQYTASGADDDVSMRVIADHARTTAFLIAEGIFPDRAARSYVLRRVMRRAIRHGHRLGIRRPFLMEVADACVHLMHEAYPALRERQELIHSISEQEEVRFRETLDRGLELIEKNTDFREEAGRRVLPGQVAFKLYDTYGFPVDLTEVIGNERGFSVDMPGFEEAMGEQRRRSEGSKVGDAAVDDVYRAVLSELPQGVKFTGYEREEGEGIVAAIVLDGRLVDSASAGERVAIVTDTTPFYGESGGQVGDQGMLRDGDNFAEVSHTDKPLPGLIVHRAEVKFGKISKGTRVSLSVHHETRERTRRNHSATHLLHWALRTVLGEQATQKGSLVGPDRLRFDFAWGAPLKEDELSRIEDLVNEKIMENAPVLTEVLPIEVARGRGAMAIFEEKYGDVVRMLTMTKDSVELCGGTHARALGEIGFFKILSEGGLAAGVRRIEAATGRRARRAVEEGETRLREASRLLRTRPEELSLRLQKLLDEHKGLERELQDLRKKVAMGGGDASDATKDARSFPGGRALSVEVESGDAATLREVAETWRDKLGDSVVLASAKGKDKVMLVVAVSKPLCDRFHAGNLAKEVSGVLGGSGGGRPDMAQAGGPHLDKLADAVQRFYALVGAG